MRLPTLPTLRSAAWLIAAMVAATTSAHAANVLAITPATPLTLTCSTTTGPGTAVNVVVKPITPLTGSSTWVVSTTSVGSGLVVTAPTVNTLSTTNQAAGITFSVNVAAGCAGATTGAATFRFSTTGNGVDVTVTANVTVTATASGLSTAPSTVALTCTRTPGSPATYAPGPAKTVAVTSAATGGTPFTVDNTSGFAPPSWLTVSPLTGGTATSTAVNLSFVAAAGCGGFAAGSTTTTTIHLLNSPAPDKTIVVTLQTVSPTPLTFSPAAPALTYAKNSGTPGKVDVTISSASSPAPFFTIDTSTLPTWLTADGFSGTTPKAIRFSSTSVADTMPPGTYSASVRVRVSLYADLVIPFTLLINNPPPKLTISEGTTRNINWTVGSPLPTPFVTAVSSDSPIPYTIDTAGQLAPIIAPASLKGLAYSFGTPIPVTFNPVIFASAQPGTILTGTVALTWGNPAATITVTFNVNIQAPGATLSAITPASLPTAPVGQSFTLVLSGSGFVPGTDTSVRTKVGIVSAGAIVLDSNIAVNVVNVSSIILTITVPSTTSTNLPFSPSGAGGTVVLGVCNPNGTTCSIPTGTTSFTIGSNPIVQAVTSASSFQQVSSSSIQTVAPYDMLSVFGTNFCSSRGTGCSSSDVLYAAPDLTTLTYPTFLSPDAVSATQRKLTVTFVSRTTPPVTLTAPLLFATNGQINIMAPAGLATYIGSTVDMYVNFGYGTSTNLLTSAAVPVNVVISNPGIFTVAASGQGDGAILSSTWSLISAGAEAGLRSTATDSDTVQIFMTGLGAPNSTADNASAGSAYTWSSDCVTTASYLTSLNSASGSSLTSLDGSIMSSSLLNTSRLVPCFVSGSARQPSVTIGGVAGVVTYAGFVPDSVAGLYQVNVRLPSSTGAFTDIDGNSLSAITIPVELPVVVTSSSRTSQAGVSMWVARRLKVTGPSGSGLTGTVGIPWSSSNNSVVATQGSPSYRYSVTSGLLPTGLTLNVNTGAITGTPAANTAGSYMITVTATDSANFPLTGKVSFTLTVGGGLVLTSANASPIAEVFGTPDTAVTTITATGGTYPYVYAITSPSTLPTGMTINAATGVIGVTALTPAGTYHVTVTATDAAATPLTGTVTFDIVVSLLVARTTPVAGTAGVASNISTVSATGNTGTLSYALDSTSAAITGLSINPSTGVISVSTSATAFTRTAIVTVTDGTAAPGASAAATGTINVAIVVN